jgi:hypothetical protein
VGRFDDEVSGFINQHFFLLSECASEDEDETVSFIGEFFDYCVGEGLSSDVFVGIGLVFTDG